MYMYKRMYTYWSLHVGARCESYSTKPTRITFYIPVDVLSKDKFKGTLLV